jgi:hypothetical protein
MIISLTAGLHTSWPVYSSKQQKIPILKRGSAVIKIDGLNASSA